jgi:deoxyribodipyrimidine photolyase-like uncharacterized protein
MIKCDYCGNESMGLAYYYSRLGTYCTSQCAEKAKKESDPSVTDLLANLARRVSSLEQQLSATQTNMEKLAEEGANTLHFAHAIERDVMVIEKRLDNGMSPKEVEVFTFENFLDSIADKVAQKIIGGGR